MIDRWWRPDFNREPTLEDLPDGQRRAVLDQVETKRRRVDRVVNAILVAWLASAAFALVAGLLDGVAKLPSAGLLVPWILVPVYANGWRTHAIRKTTARAVLQQVRRHRLDEINAIISGH